jgi:hypothetical protein
LFTGAEVHLPYGVRASSLRRATPRTFTQLCAPPRRNNRPLLFQNIYFCAGRHFASFCKPARQPDTIAFFNCRVGVSPSAAMKDKDAEELRGIRPRLKEGDLAVRGGGSLCVYKGVCAHSFA